MKTLANKVISSSIITASRGSSLKNGSILVGGTFNTLPLINIGKHHPSFSIIEIARRNYHATSSKMFFDLKKAKQEAETVVYSEQEQNELIKNYQLLEDKFQRLTENIIEYRRNHPTPVQLETNHLFVQVCDIVNFCYKTFPTGSAPVNMQVRFFKSNVGMKSYVLMKKVELLMLKIVNQEWFPVETIRTQFHEENIMESISDVVHPPDTPIDDTLFLYASYNTALSYAAFIPKLNIRDMVRPITKENLIAATLFLFNRLKDFPDWTDEFRAYVECVFSDYESAKLAYTTANPIENEPAFHYNADDNAYSYLGKTFTEHEFDWFEDIETNIPIHLGNFIKAVSAAAYFDGDRKQSIDILDECIKTDPKNIYIHYLKASCLNNLTSSESDLNIVRNNYSDAIHHLEKALAYLENIPKLPLPTLAKTNFSHEIEEPEKQVERINDLKFTPICLLLANVYARAAESGVSIDLRHIYGAKGVDYVRQVELYSRSPNEPYLYMSKGGCYYACGMYELAVNAYSSVERFEAVLDPNAIIDSLCYASNGMVALGYSDKCLEAMEFYIEKYNNDARLVFQKILCKEYMCRSKDELRQVLKEFEQLKESIQDLKLTPWIYSRVNEQTDARINDIFAAINNPQIAERW